MGFDNKYPYTDFHEINLDWLLEKVKGIDDRFTAIEDAVAALREDLDIQTGRIDAALDHITFIEQHYPAMIASQYDEERQYDPGEIAIYDNELYIALPGETPGPWNGNFWNKTSLGDELGTIIIKVNDIILPDLTNINNVLAEYGTLFDDIIETYDPNFTYYKNQFAKYEDHIYMVMVDSTTNPPTDTADWDPVTFANVFSYYINNLNVFVPEFQDNVPYRQYDYVRYNNYVYYLKVATFTGPWDPTKWENCVFSQEEAFHTRAFYDMFGTLYGWYKSFDDADTYNKGDAVNYNGTLYECMEDNVTGVWDASKWQVQKVTDAMTNVNTYYKNFPVKTINGNPVEITDAVAAPADAAIVSFLPIQEGSGDPSPNNIRPITGWNALHLYTDEEQSLTPANTYTITFDSTVYGGSYDFVSGKLVIDRVLYALNGNENFIATSNNRVYFTDLSDIYIPTLANTIELYCSHFKCGSQSTYTSGTVYKSTSNTAVVFCDDTLCTDITTFKNYVTAQYNANTPVVVVYKLATPIEITLTPEDIELLRGDNAIWTDGDNVELQYHFAADTSLPVYSTSYDTQIGTTGTKRVMQKWIEVTGLSSGTVNLSGIMDFTDVDKVLSFDGCYFGDDDGVIVTIGAAQYIKNPSGDATFYINAIGTNTTYTLEILIKYIAV